MSLKFTKEMFEDFSIYASPQEIAAAKAQEAFDKWLESQPIVYGDEDGWLTDKWDNDTHQARLVNIEPIEKPKLCDHVFSDLVIKPAGDLPLIRATCTECGAKFFKVLDGKR